MHYYVANLIFSAEMLKACSLWKEELVEPGQRTGRGDPAGTQRVQEHNRELKGSWALRPLKNATRKVVLWCRDLKDRRHFKRKHYVSSFLWIPFTKKIAPRIPLLLLCDLVKHHTPQLMAQLHSLEPLNEGQITPNNLFLSFMDR